MKLHGVGFVLRCLVMLCCMCSFGHLPVLGVCAVVQVQAFHSGVSPTSGIILPNEAVQQQVIDTVTRGGGGVSAGRWGIGELEFEALVRELEAKVSLKSSITAPVSSYS